MPVSLTPVNTGDKVKAQDLIDLVDYYNEIWDGGAYLYDANHHTDAERRYGWGQGQITLNTPPISFQKNGSAVIDGTLITATDLNEITAYMNAGLYHGEDDPIKSANVEGLHNLIDLTTYPKTEILAAYHNSILNKIQWFRQAPKNKYQIDWANFDLAAKTTTTTANWDNNLEIVHKFTFQSYNKARHFFNAGGELTLELEMDPGGASGNQVWEGIFDQFDSIRIGAEGCRVVADNVYDVIATSGVNYGFYNGLQYLYGGGSTASEDDFRTILDAGVFAYTNNTATEATVYLYSEYNSRRIRLQMRAEDIGSEFNIYVRLILVEDVDDNFDITQPITLSSGYVQPATTPLATDPNLSKFTVDSYPYYKFTEIPAPDVSLDTDWREPLINESHAQLDWRGHAVSNVDAGHFITGQEYTIVSVNDNIQVEIPYPGTGVLTQQVITGKQYRIVSVGTTDFTKMGAANNNVNTVFTATRRGTGTGIVGGATSVDTDFVLIGAIDNVPGTVFTATGPGTGSGIATETPTGSPVDPGEIWQSTGLFRYNKI